MELKEILRLKIESLIRDEGVGHFISGMARGVDTYAAEIVLELKKTYDVTLECALPCGEQVRLWEAGDRERYDRILKEADQATLEMWHFMKDCHSIRNKYMVDKSDIVIVVWNGEPSGTGKTVAYARDKKKKIVIIDPATFRVYLDYPKRQDIDTIEDMMQANGHKQ